jgi:chromosome segregation ATPase
MVEEMGMDSAVQEGLDTLASLEERITRTVEVVSSLRQENRRLHENLQATGQELETTKGRLEEAQSLSSEFQKENEDLTRRLERTTQELEGLRGERKQVKARVEKLLTQLDLLTAS